MITLTPDQLHILQHSLGCDSHGRTEHRANSDDHFGRYYRNHYVSHPDADLTALVTAGLMKDYPPSDLYGDFHCYCVTQEGVAAMIAQSPKPPKLTRAQQRYRAYLRADSGESFGEWLKRTAWNAKVESLEKIGLTHDEIRDWMENCYGRKFAR